MDSSSIPPLRTLPLVPVEPQLRSTDRKATGSLPALGADQAQKPSMLVQFAVSRDIRELTFNREETQFAYYKQDNSLALRAHSQMNVNLRQEEYRFDLTFSAEALGLSAKDFAANGGKPITLRLAFEQSMSELNVESTTRLVKTLRKPSEIIGDLGKALAKVISQKGDKVVTYSLDREAMEALMGDRESLELLAELVMMMAVMNALQRGENPSRYHIEVSGKGKPYIDHEEKTTLNATSVKVEFNLTINPPAQMEAAEPVGESLDVAA